MSFLRIPAILLVCLCASIIAGCASSSTDREMRMQCGYVYYLDGAGGGGAIRNYAQGVRKGLVDAGYPGSGEIFKWETGLGIVADQTSSENYKRKKAAELAAQIQEYHSQHRSAPITIMGLSAGTAVAVFALESLPVDIQVDSVVLLSGSLSSSYDLTRALKRVRGKMYIFTSNHDAVLGFLVPISGTADRASGSEATIGLSGPLLPMSASAETRRQYAKIVEVPWNKEFEDHGNYGGHTDTVKAAFVQEVVAPLVVGGATPTARRPSSEAGRTRTADAGEVANPMFERWSKFGAGSWVEFRGYQMIDGRQHPVRVKSMIVQSNKDMLVISRQIEGLTAGGDEAPVERRLFVTRTVNPANNPQTAPESETTEMGRTQIEISGQRFDCVRHSIVAKGEFSEWGTNPHYEIVACPQIPGGLASLSLKTNWNGRPTEVSVDAVAYAVAR